MSIDPADSVSRSSRHTVRFRAIARHLSSFGRGILLAVLLGVIAGAGLWWWRQSYIYVSTDNAYVVGNITPISAEVGGQVVALYTDDNMVVQAGEPLVQLDPIPYQLAVDQATADLAQARADALAADTTVRLNQQNQASLLEGAQAKVPEYEKLLQSARLDVDNRRFLLEKNQQTLDSLRAQAPGLDALLQNARDYQDRFTRMAANGAVSGQALDDKQATYQDAQARFASLQANIAAAEHQVSADRVSLDQAAVKVGQAENQLQQVQAMLGQAQATQLQPKVAAANAQAQANKVIQAEAKLRQTKLNLGYTLVRAPQTGIVSKRTIQLGQTVAARQPFLSIVPLDFDNVWIVANLREEQMARVRVGEPVRIRLDGIPGQEFSGYVESVEGGTGAVFSLFPPDNATGNFTRVVQRLPVRIRFTEKENLGMRIRPGMSVQVTIDTTRLVRQENQSW
jgi:membrane fusion protein (multidrug efflux system)